MTILQAIKYEHVFVNYGNRWMTWNPKKAKWEVWRKYGDGRIPTLMKSTKHEEKAIKELLK